MANIVDYGDVRCIKRGVYDKYKFLKQLTASRSAARGSDELRVSQGLAYDGAIVIRNDGKNEGGHVLTDDGRLYKNLTELQIERFKRGILLKQPSQRVSAGLASRFIVEVFGDAELSKKGRKKHCSNPANACKADPEHNHRYRYYLSARGEYERAMKEFKFMFAAFADTKTFDEAIARFRFALNSSNPQAFYGFLEGVGIDLLRKLAVMIAKANDAAFRKKYMKDAIEYATIALRAARIVEEGTVGKQWWMLPCYVALAQVYAASGQYILALNAIPEKVMGNDEKTKDVWKIPGIQALRESFAWEYLLSGKAVLDYAEFVFSCASSLLFIGNEDSHRK